MAYTSGKAENLYSPMRVHVQETSCWLIVIDTWKRNFMQKFMPIQAKAYSVSIYKGKAGYVDLYSY